MADPSGPDEATIVRAVELKRAGRTESQIADELGVSRSTAHSYVVKGHAHVMALGAANLAGEQADAADQFQALLGRVLARMDNTHDDTDRGDGEFAALVREARALITQRTRTIGAEAATKLDVTNRPGREQPDMTLRDRGLILALERIDERDVADDRELRAGRPGVLPGG